MTCMNFFLSFFFFFLLWHCSDPKNWRGITFITSPRGVGHAPLTPLSRPPSPRRRRPNANWSSKCLVSVRHSGVVLDNMKSVCVGSHHRKLLTFYVLGLKEKLWGEACVCLRACLRVCVGVETEDFFFVCLRQTKEPPSFSTPTRDVTHIVAPLVFDYVLFLWLVTLVASEPDLSARLKLWL